MYHLLFIKWVRASARYFCVLVYTDAMLALNRLHISTWKSSDFRCSHLSSTPELGVLNKGLTRISSSQSLYALPLHSWGVTAHDPRHRFNAQPVTMSVVSLKEKELLFSCKGSRSSRKLQPIRQQMEENKKGTNLLKHFVRAELSLKEERCFKLVGAFCLAWISASVCPVLCLSVRKMVTFLVCHFRKSRFNTNIRL